MSDSRASDEETAKMMDQSKTTPAKDWITSQLKDALGPYGDMKFSELTDDQIYAIYTTVISLKFQAREAFHDN